MQPLPIIQIDTREKEPFKFAQAFRDKKIAGITNEKLDCGDYALKDSKLVVIERKKNVAELYNNFIPDEKRERFHREMERLQQYKYRYIVVSQTWDALYEPNEYKYIRVNQYSAGSIILGNLLSIMNKYQVHVIFAGEHAERTTLSILLKHYADQEKEVKEKDNGK